MAQLELKLITEPAARLSREPFSRDWSVGHVRCLPLHHFIHRPTIILTYVTNEYKVGKSIRNQGFRESTPLP